MSHSADDVRAHVRTYITIFVALLILTGVTVGVSYVHLESIMERVVLAMIVAGAKGTLVALFFMHLKSERPLIYVTLAFTAVFIVAVFALPKWSDSDHVIGSTHKVWDAGVKLPTLPGHEAAGGHGEAGHGEGGH